MIIVLWVSPPATKLYAWVSFPVGFLPLPALLQSYEFLPISVGVANPVIRRPVIVDDVAVSVCHSFLVDQLSLDTGATYLPEPHSGDVLYRGCRIPLLLQWLVAWRRDLRRGTSSTSHGRYPVASVSSRPSCPNPKSSQTPPHSGTFSCTPNNKHYLFCRRLAVHQGVQRWCLYGWGGKPQVSDSSEVGVLVLEIVAYPG